MGDSHRRAAVAERAARAGAAVARKTFRGEFRVETKASKNDLVTEADRDAQRQAIATIREEFPRDAVVGEEDAVPLEGPEADADSVEVLSKVPADGDTWVIDPIDGTTNYSLGGRLWGTVVAAVVDGETVAGATYLPTVEDMYAVGPEGPTRNGEPLSVSERTDPETFVVAPVGWYPSESAEQFGSVCRESVAAFGDVRRYGSMQATLAFVASGELDAAFSPTTEHPWDTMAGVRLVRAAGGTVTDLDGDRWRHDSEGFVASNGGAHEAVREVARVAAERTGPEG